MIRFGDFPKWCECICKKVGSCPHPHRPAAERFTLAGAFCRHIHTILENTKHIGLFWLVGCLGFLFSPGAFAVSPETVRLNNEGVEFFNTEQYHEAYKKFTEGLGVEPFDPYIQSNLGHSFLSNEEKEKAFDAFKAARELAKKSGDHNALFSTTFNLATMKAINGDVAGALKDFQFCLDMNPPQEHVQLVRENIEKMWQAQQGQGQGGQDDQQQKNQDQQDGEGQQDQQQQQNPDQGDQQQEQKKKKPKPFDSKELTKDDVRKILEELKNQEQKIRAEVYEGQGKERPRDKDW